MGTCFVFEPLKPVGLEALYRQTIESPIRKSGLAPQRVDQRSDISSLSFNLESAIRSCACVIADLSENSMEVWFWAGVAAAHRKEIIFICDISKPAPTNCGQVNILQYSLNSPEPFERRLSARLRQAIKKHDVLKTLAHSFPDPYLDKASLSDSEMNVLQIVKDSLLSPQDSVMPNKVRMHLENMGFFGQTITSGLESLRDKGMIELGEEQGSFYRPYPVYQITEAGSKWLQENYLPIVTKSQTQPETSRPAY